MKMPWELLDHPNTGNIIMIPKMTWFTSHVKLCNYKNKLKWTLASMNLRNTLTIFTSPNMLLCSWSKQNWSDAFLWLNEQMSFIVLWGFSLCLHYQFMLIWRYYLNSFWPHKIEMERYMICICVLSRRLITFNENATGVVGSPRHRQYYHDPKNGLIGFSC